MLEAEPSALPLAGGSVNALVGNYQAHCLVYPAGLGRARDAWLVGTLRSARIALKGGRAAMAPLPFSHCTAGGCTQTQGHVCTDYATSSAGPAPGAGLARPGGRLTDVLTALAARAAGPGGGQPRVPGRARAGHRVHHGHAGGRHHQHGRAGQRPRRGHARRRHLCAPRALRRAARRCRSATRRCLLGGARRLRRPCTAPVSNPNASRAAAPAPLTRGCSCARRRHPNRQAMTLRLGPQPDVRARTGERSARRLGKCAACAHSVYSSARGCAGRLWPYG